MGLAARAGDESVSLAWLEDAIEHAHAHGQMEVLAYLEAVKEDVAFESEIAATRKGFTLG